MYLCTYAFICMCVNTCMCTDGDQRTSSDSFPLPRVSDNPSWPHVYKTDRQPMDAFSPSAFPGSGVELRSSGFSSINFGHLPGLTLLFTLFIFQDCSPCYPSCPFLLPRLSLSIISSEGKRTNVASNHMIGCTSFQLSRKQLS